MAVDLATITRDAFEAVKGTRFVMRVSPGHSVELELLETEALPTPPRAPRAAFLVRFRAAEVGHVPQRIYTLEHATLGAMDLFLVPAGPDQVGMRYDAVFS